MDDARKRISLPEGENEVSKILYDMYYKNEDWQKAIDGLITMILRETNAEMFLLDLKKLHGCNLSFWY